MLALSIRQPYAEEILRGLKKAEYRSTATHKVDERFYLYAAKGIPPEEQLRRYSRLCKSRAALKAAGFRTGYIVGTAIISECVAPRRKGGDFAWRLTGVKRLIHPRKPVGRPQPRWFRPF